MAVGIYNNIPTVRKLAEYSDEYTQAYKGCPLTPQTIIGLSRTLNLRWTHNFHQNPLISPPGITALNALPLQYIVNRWEVVIYAIYIFNTLAKEQQQKEIDISNSLAPAQKKKHIDIRTYLMNNPMPPLLHGYYNIPHIKQSIDDNFAQHFYIALSLFGGSDDASIANISRRTATSTTLTTTTKTKTTTTTATRSSTKQSNKRKVTKKKNNMKWLMQLPQLPKQCQKCKYIFTRKVVKKALPHTYATYTDKKCIQCTEGELQNDNLARKNNSLQNINKQQVSSPQSCIKSNTKIEVSLRNFVTAELPEHAAEILQLYNNQHKLKVSVIELEKYILTNKEFNTKKSQINGATWTENINDNPHPNILRQDDETDITVIKLPARTKQAQSTGKQDFITISNANFDQSCVDEFCQHDNKSVQQKKTGSRPGPASGVALLSDGSHSFTPVTQKQTSLKLAASKNGCAMRMVYENDHGKAKICNFGYKPVDMDRLTKAKKEKEAKQYAFYREILLKEAMMYIASIASVVAAGISIPKHNNFYLRELCKILSNKKEDDSIEESLVKWMVTTGEMRNHQALACHVDTNKSHPLEIYSVFHRVGAVKMNGLLYLPLDNVCIEMICDKNVAVCSLSRTPHVPDQSRNTNNISKTHGPCA